MELWSLIALGVGVLIAIIGLIGFDFDLGPIDPLTVGCFSTVFGGSTWIAIQVTNDQWASFFIGIIVAVVATIVVQLAILPLRKAEASMASELSDMVGIPANVILDIPPDGAGEILIQNKYGRVNRMAASYEKKGIPSGKKVIIVEIKDSICYVIESDTLDEEINKL